MKINNSVYATTSDKSFLRQLERQLSNYKKSVEYSFATAYFDFKVLSEYFSSLELAIQNGLVVKFLISNHISVEEFNIIKRAKDSKINDFLNLYPNDHLSINERKKLFYWLKNEKIKFKVVFKSKGIFHYKMGYIKFKDGSVFSWTGSANHTLNGLSGINEEHILFNNNKSFNESFEYKLFINAWNGRLNESYVVDADKVLASEISVSLDDNINMNITWFKEKWEKSLIFINNTIYFINNNGIIIYFAPEANWDSINDYVIISKDLNFNKIKMLNWISKNADCYVSSNLLAFLKDNISKIENDIKLGLNIKNSWSKIKESDEFKDFLSTTTNLKRKPFDLQYKQAFFASNLKKTLNFSVPGTGKTMVTLVAFNFLKIKKRIRNLFIIGPTASHDSWYEEFEETFGRAPKVINLSKIKGDFDQKYRFINNIKSDDFEIIIMHFATASNYWYSLLKIISDDTFFVIDEAHYIKNYNGQWGKNISRLGDKSNYSILLTGTPAPNGIEDIYNIISITYGKPFMYHFIHSDNKAELISALHMKINYSDLGMKFKQINHFHSYRLNEQQKVILNEINNQMKIAKGQNVLELLTKRQQLLSSEKLLIKEEYSIENSYKLQELKKMLNPKMNIVIWANYTKSIDSIYNMINRFHPETKVYKYYGSEDTQNRSDTIKDYKKFGGILIANPFTLAEAVSLHKNTDFTIYYEYNFNLIHWQQSRNRTYRYGMENDMHYHILTCSDDFLDKRILSILMKKSFFQENLINKDNHSNIAIDEIKLLIERMS